MRRKASWKADLELVRAVLAERPVAVTTFLERMRYAHRALGVMNDRAGRPFSAADIEEISQDVFLRVWRRLDQFEGRSHLESWVHRFADLTFRERRRGHARNAALRPIDASSEDLVEHRLDGRQPSVNVERLDDALVLEALERLPESKRSVIQLKLFEGLSFDDVAQHLEINTNTAKARYYRALEGLAGDLESRFSEEDSP